MSYFSKRALKIVTTGPSRINPTLVRKYTTSIVHEHVPEIKQSTANLLCHSLRVAESNYAIYDKQKKAVNASNLVKNVQRSTFEEGGKTNTEDSQKYSSKMSSKITRYEQIPFEDIFSSYIEKKVIYLADVREVVTKEDKIFDQFVIDDKFLIKVRDTVRYIIKCNMRGCDIVKDDGSNEVSDNEAKKSPLKENENKVKTRVCFSEAENEFIRQHFDRYINSTEPLVRSEFTEYVYGREELKELVKKSGINRLFVKMCTKRNSRK